MVSNCQAELGVYLAFFIHLSSSHPLF